MKKFAKRLKIRTFICVSCALFLLNCQQQPQDTEVQANSLVRNPQVNAVQLPDHQPNQLVEEALAEFGEGFNDPTYVGTVASAYSNKPGISVFNPSDGLALTDKKNVFAELLGNVQRHWNSANKSLCNLFKDSVRKGSGAMLARPYFFVGASREIGAVAHYVEGRDIVWDLYNMQLSSFTFRAAEIVVGGGMFTAVGGNGFFGLGFGRRNSVEEAWSGYFKSAGISGSLPFLSDILSAPASGFMGSPDGKKNDPSFVGASLGASVAFAIPSAAPAALQVSTGFWKINRDANSLISKKLRSAKVPHSMSGADTCGGKCIRIDSQGRASYVKRAQQLARSIPLIVSPTGQALFFPNFEKILLLALATGALRDSANASYKDMCAK